MDIVKIIIYTTIRDAFFCLCLLFLCFNPYAALSDKWRFIIIFSSFILYLLIPRILNCTKVENDFDIAVFNKIAEHKENFVATLSHDLKTPALSQIKSLQILLDESLGSLNTEQKSLLTLLATYKFKSGTVTLNYEDFDTLALIKECTEEIKSLAHEKKLNIQIDSESKNNIVCADRMQIKRVIMNLLANAISYALKNTVINITIVNDRGFFRFYIENSGSYIEDEILKQLFNKYSSFASKYKRTSTGLGLYLSRKIIEAHLGIIKAESFIEGKNIFSFYIPSFIEEEAKQKKKQRLRF